MLIAIAVAVSPTMIGQIAVGEPIIRTLPRDLLSGDTQHSPEPLHPLRLSRSRTSDRLALALHATVTGSVPEKRPVVQRTTISTAARGPAMYSARPAPCCLAQRPREQST
ncbi:MAG: hypothetical protein R3B46_14325 [Phycisphaerales bacterium]